MTDLAIFLLSSLAGSLIGMTAWRLWTQWEPTQRLFNEDRDPLAQTQDVPVFHDGETTRD